MVKEAMERTLETKSTNRLDPWHLHHQLPDPSQRRSGALRVAAPNPASLGTDSPDAPWCGTRGSEAPQLAFRILAREPNYFLHSF